MSLKFALVGNPNCGKTTLFNEITVNETIATSVSSWLEEPERLFGYRISLQAEL